MAEFKNTYTEDFKINVVSAVRAGIRVTNIARKFQIPPNTVSTWLHKKQYAMIAPATAELLKTLPDSTENNNSNRSTFVQVLNKPTLPNTTESTGSIKNSVKISYGKLNMEFTNGLNVEDLKTIIQALGGKDVL